MQSYDIHSEVWPMTPQDARYGYTPTFQRGPLLRQPLGVPVTMEGRRKTRRQRRAAKRRRIAAAVLLPGVGKLGLLIGRNRTVNGLQGRRLRRAERKITRAIRESRRTRLPVTLTNPDAIQLNGSTTVHYSTRMSGAGMGFGTAFAQNLATSAAVGAASAPAASTGDFGDEHLVPAGRDPQTHFRQLGFSQTQARRLADAPVSQREALMHEFGYRREQSRQTFAAIGGVLQNIGSEVRDFFRPAERAATPEREVVYREAAPQGMSTTTMALIGAAGLAGAFLLMKAAD